VSAKKRADEEPPVPKSYGRQGEEKTITSISLDKNIAKAARKIAKLRGISFSQMVNEVLAAASGIEAFGHTPKKPGRESKSGGDQAG
jgi:hypothetical protein